MSWRKELQIASFENWINLLETKNYFFTYLLFCLFLTEKFSFYLITFGMSFHIWQSKQKIWHMPFSISLSLAITFWYFFCLSHYRQSFYIWWNLSAVYTLIFQITIFWFYIFDCYWGLKPMVSLRLVYYRFSTDC